MKDIAMPINWIEFARGNCILSIYKSDIGDFVSMAYDHSHSECTYLRPFGEDTNWFGIGRDSYKILKETNRLAIYVWVDEGEVWYHPNCPNYDCYNKYLESWDVFKHANYNIYDRPGEPYLNGIASKHRFYIWDNIADENVVDHIKKVRDIDIKLLRVFSDHDSVKTLTREYTIMSVLLYFRERYDTAESLNEYKVCELENVDTHARSFITMHGNNGKELSYMVKEGEKVISIYDICFKELSAAKRSCKYLNNNVVFTIG